MKVLKTYGIKIVMILLLFVGVNQHSALAGESLFQDSIYFKHSPPDLTKAGIGDVINYYTNAHSVSGKNINYKLINPPNSDAEVNKTTGVFKYIPTESGEFKFTIRSYLESDETVFNEQTLNCEIRKCNSVIDGSITLNNLTPSGELRGKVSVLGRDSQNNLILHAKSSVSRTGTFKTVSDDGKYILKFEGYVGNQSIVAWYDSKTDSSDADEVTLDCNATTNLTWNIDFVNTNGYYVYIEQIGEYPFSLVSKGEAFEEKIEFITNPKDEEVVFSLSSEDHFSLIGPNNDILKLNSTEPGFYNVGVTARLKNHTHITTSEIVRVWVSECDDFNEITINIIDKETGEKIEGLIDASLYKLDSTSRDSLNYAMLIDSTFSENSKFTFNLDKGEYFLEAYIGVTIEGRYTQYRYVYNFDEPTNNNLNETKGESIKVDCENQTLTWEIRAPKEVKSYTISGYVKDEKTNNAIQYARIEAIGKNKLTDNISRKYAYCNDNGYYSLRVQNDAIYSVSAFTYEDTLDLKIYDREYWEETSNPLEATILDLDANAENINFTLTQKSDYKNKFDGVVIDEDDKGVESATVILYLVEPTAFDTELLYLSTSISTNSAGEFEFENLTPGDYIVYTYTNDRNYIPGYFDSKSDNLATSWLDATKITVEKSGNFGDIEIRLAPIKPSNSNKGISGKVGVLKGVSPESVQSISPLSGVQVFVTDENDNVINFDYSDNIGSFNIPNLIKGELNIYFDKVGFIMSKDQVIIDNDNENFVLEAEMQPVGTTNVIPFTQVNANIYPNPSSGQVNISGDFTDGEYTIKVIDMTGNTIKIIPTKISQSKTSLDLSSLFAGQYFIKIVGDSAVYSTKVTIIK